MLGLETDRERGGGPCEATSAPGCIAVWWMEDRQTDATQTMHRHLHAQ